MQAQQRLATLQEEMIEKDAAAAAKLSEAHSELEQVPLTQSVMRPTHPATVILTLAVVIAWVGACHHIYRSASSPGRRAGV
jgi:hypothetical protein